MTTDATLLTKIETLEKLKIKLAAEAAPYDEIIEEAKAELAEKTKALTAMVDSLQKDIKAEVIKHGKGIKAPEGRLNVVYTKGRETWDSKKLTQHISENPWLADCKKLGSPSISIRFK